MERTETLFLPRDLIISNATAIDSIRFILWNTDTSVVTVATFPDKVVTFKLPPGTKAVGAALIADTVIAVMDRATSSVLSLSLNTGAFLGAISLPGLSKWRVVEAFWASGKWYGIGRSPSGTTALFQVGVEGASPSYKKMGETDLPDSLVQLALGLNGKLLVSSKVFPFEVMSFPGREMGSSSLFEAVNFAVADSLERSLAYGMGVITLDCGYLRAIADLGSDRRWLVRYGFDGALKARVAVEAAMGFVASDPASKTALAAIRTSQMALVRYRWKWSTGTGKSP